jgi:hypothetical protein
VTLSSSKNVISFSLSRFLRVEKIATGEITRISRVSFGPRSPRAVDATKPSSLGSNPPTEFHQATNHTFDPYMPIVVNGAILGGVALATISPGIHSVAGQAVAGAKWGGFVVNATFSLAWFMPASDSLGNRRTHNESKIE